MFLTFETQKINIGEYDWKSYLLHNIIITIAQKKLDLIETKVWPRCLFATQGSNKTREVGKLV